MTNRYILTSVALCAAMSAQAAEYVDKADVDGDGYVSLYELRAAHYADPEFNRMIEEMFQRYDRNGDGRISEDERRATGGEPDVATVIDPVEVRGSTESEELAPLTLKRDSSMRGDSTRAGGSALAVPAARSENPQDPNQTWLMQVDSNGSGGASKKELIDSSDGDKWFSNAEFDAADQDGNEELDARELGELVRSLQRRHR